MRSRSITGAALLVGIAFAGQAWAAAPAFPASLAGTWELNGNTHLGTMTLAQGVESGGCFTLTGAMVYGAVSDEVKGTYCPATGFVAFARNKAGVTIQTWVGQAGRVRGAQDPWISGQFAAVRPAGGGPGEYGFVAFLAQD